MCFFVSFVLFVFFAAIYGESLLADEECEDWLLFIGSICFIISSWYLTSVPLLLFTDAVLHSLNIISASCFV
jgi:hypothetical protein